MTVVVLDTFTDTTGTALNAHTPDTDTVGTGWEDAGVVGDPATANSGTIQDNAALPAADSNKGAVIDSGEADGTITVDWTPQASRDSVVFRYTDNENHFLFNMRQPNGDWRLQKRSTAGGTEELDSGSFAWDGTGATTYQIKIFPSGNNIDVSIDGTPTASAIDAHNSTATRHGIARASSDGLERFDNFTVEDAGAGSVTGTGALTLPALTIAGTGQAGEIETADVFVVGGGANLNLPAITLSGTGSAVGEVTGTGAITLPAATVEGTGLAVSTITGTGAITLPAATVSGVGRVGLLTRRSVIGCGGLTHTGRSIG